MNATIFLILDKICLNDTTNYYSHLTGYHCFGKGVVRVTSDKSFDPVTLLKHEAQRNPFNS